MLTFIINAIEKEEFLPDALELLRKFAGERFETFVLSGTRRQAAEGDVRRFFVGDEVGNCLGAILNRIVEEASGEYICYLHQDVLALPGLCGKLKRALEESGRFAAVLPMANASREARFVKNLPLRSDAELFEQGESINHSAPSGAAAALKIDDYFILFERTFLRRLRFQERFATSLYVMQDFALRAAQEGAPCALVQGAYVYNRGGHERQKERVQDTYLFHKLWGMTRAELFSGADVLSMMDFERESLRILIAGCKTGALFYEILAKHPAAQLYGLFTGNYPMLADSIAQIEPFEPDAERFPYGEGVFDYVIVDGVSESCSSVPRLLGAARNALLDTGELIAICENAQYYAYLKALVEDAVDVKNTRDYSENAQRRFTYEQLGRFIADAGFDLADIKARIGGEDAAFIESLRASTGTPVHSMVYRVRQYLIYAYKANRGVLFLLRRLEYGFECEKNAVFLAEAMKTAACSWEHLLFYLATQILFQKNCMENFLCVWNARREYELIDAFSKSYMKYEGLDDTFLIGALEKVVG